MNAQATHVHGHPLLALISDAKRLDSIVDEFGTPLYVYDAVRLRDNVTRLNSAVAQSFGKYKICYALKANTNPHIISVLKSAVPTIGADCSSPGELYIAKEVGIAPESIIYTGNYESPGELQIALNSHAHLNLDDMTSYDRLKRIGLPGEISFRLNPGFGKGMFPAIVTAGQEAKFGVPREKIVETYRRAKEDRIERFGLQCMTGSGNLDEEYFVQLLTTILTVAREIEDKLSVCFSFISMGGGLGIPYREEDEPLAVNRLFRQLSEVFNRFYDGNSSGVPALFIEPGKYLVGDAGFLLARVTGLKESYKSFVGLDAGMNTLVRPALYHAYHRIYKVGDPAAPPAKRVDVTGGICENTDRLAVDRPFPQVSAGDLVAIMDAGAYGFTMANQYNTRPRPAEILLHGDEVKLIRRRETIEEIFRLCDWNKNI